MTIRIALALLFIVPAAMAYPWDSDIDWWIFGIAIGVTLVVFAWWRGLFVTNMIGRRWAIWRRNHSKPKSTASNDVTLVLQVDDPAGVGLPLPLVAGYVERFGVRCTKVRVTNRDERGVRTTWISMTLSATDNLAALRARSAELPLGARQPRSSVAAWPITFARQGCWPSSSTMARRHLPAAAARRGGASARTTGSYRRTESRSTTASPSGSPRCGPSPYGDLDGARIQRYLSTSHGVRAVRLPDRRGGARRACGRSHCLQPGIQRPLLTALDPASADRLDIPSSSAAAGTLGAGRVAGGWALVSRT